MESLREIEARLRELKVPETYIQYHCRDLHKGRSRRNRYRLGQNQDKPEKRHYVQRRRHPYLDFD